ncbi:hypothetical protein OAD30_02895, partial [Alphaproteobacteria bacterium]|nr:hypothetical protein [Alphaproteobacteria bacterium]
MYKLLFYIVQISYIAISKSEKVSLSRWAKAKNRFNFLINRKIIRWMANNPNSEKYSFGDQFVIDSIIELVFIHYRQRVVIYGFLKKVPCFRRELFIQISFVFILIGLLGKLLREVQSTLYVYKKVLFTDKKINLSLSFPKHSFNVAPNYNFNECYSFGEYLTVNYPNTAMFSIHEYVRHSKKKGDDDISNYPSNFKRINPLRERKTTLFFVRILKVIFHLLFKDNKVHKGIFLKLIYFRKYLYQSNFKNMIFDIGIDYKNIETIFILPFADLGLLKYKDKFYKKISAFSYSQNALIMPSPNLQVISDQINFFQYMPLYHLTLTEQSYGFTSLYFSVNKIKERLNNEFSLKLPVTNVSEHEYPITLGYEKVNFPSFIEKKITKQRVIAIFDVPPASNYDAISRSTNGDKINGYEFIENFIIDTVETSILNEFTIIIKPKYSLSNYNDSYGNLLKFLTKKYKNKIIIAEPYLRMGAIVKYSCGSINIPYTSTKLIFENNNIPSIYYVSEKYRHDFTNNNAKNIQFGNFELDLFLKSLQK